MIKEIGFQVAEEYRGNNKIVTDVNPETFTDKPKLSDGARKLLIDLMVRGILNHTIKDNLVIFPVSLSKGVDRNMALYLFNNGMYPTDVSELLKNTLPILIGSANSGIFGIYKAISLSENTKFDNNGEVVFYTEENYPYSCIKCPMDNSNPVLMVSLK